MTEVKYSDPSGCTMTLINVDGRNLTPANSREQWNAVTAILTRPDDVFVCAYPKSGFHWLWEIVSMLRSGDATPIKEHMEGHILDFIPTERMSAIDQRPPPRTFTTHMYPDEMPTTTFERKCKIVYLLRDPRDISVSYYNHLVKLKGLDYEGEFKDFIHLFLHGKVPFNSWWEHIRQWYDIMEKKPEQPFMVVYYEDMKKDPAREMKRLASFLEVEANEDLISNIISSTTFATMKSAKESLENKLVVYYKTGKEIMYRKGEIGDWKNWFNDEKITREFDEYIKSKLQGIDYTRLVDPQRYACLQ